MPTMKCIICGKSYKACADCGKYGGWKTLCDTSDHYKIYEIIQQHRLGTPVGELKEMLNSISDESKLNLLPSVQEYLDKNILKTKATKRKVAKDIDTSVQREEQITE